jgi:hypothetical protein
VSSITTQAIPASASALRRPAPRRPAPVSSAALGKPVGEGDRRGVFSPSPGGGGTHPTDQKTQSSIPTGPRVPRVRNSAFSCGAKGVRLSFVQPLFRTKFDWH